MPTSKISYLLSEQRLTELIGHVIAHMSTDDRGRVSWGVTFGMDATLEIISRNIRIPEIEDVDAVRKLSNQALTRLYTEGGKKNKTFKRILAEEAQRYLESPREEYQVVLMLNAGREDLERIGPFDLLGTVIQTTEWQELENGFDTKRWFDEMEGYRIWDPKALKNSFTFTPMIAKAKGRDVREGFNAASEGFHLFRALLNMASGFRRRWIMRDPPLADFLQSPVFGLFDSKGQYLSLYYALSKYKYDRKDLREERAAFFKSLLSQIRTPNDPNETMSLTIDALRKYGEAMDAAEWQRSFLSLWQIVEAVTLQLPFRLNFLHNPEFDPFSSLKR